MDWVKEGGGIERQRGQVGGQGDGVGPLKRGRKANVF